MNQNQQPKLPLAPDVTPGMSPAPFPDTQHLPDPVRPFSYWLKKFLACNPFYLVSAALLLYGLYLVSSDARFLAHESSQLAFNFSSLQIYEILLVATAIILARRRIWYDSTLLVGLENMLVLVPFILISQAALLNPRLVWMICLAGGIAALFRFWGLKQCLKELNLPRAALVGGFILLAINVALPLVFRHLHDSKIGTKPTEGAAYELNRYSWLILLPAMFALINLLPRSRQLGELLPQRRWLPMGLFALWLIASGMHLYSLSYVYNFDWEPGFAAPLAWVIAWSFYLRHPDFLGRPISLLSNLSLIPPVAVTLLALNVLANPVFMALTLCNLAVYFVLLLKEKGNRVALHLLLISCGALAFGFSRMLSTGLPSAFNSEKCLIFCGALYLLYWAVRSTNPKIGLFGSVVIAAALLLEIELPCVAHLALQFAAIFLLLHSLRWRDEEHQGSVVLRLLACGIWVGHAGFLLHTGWTYMLPLVYGTSGALLLACVMKRLLNNSWQPVILPVAGTFVMLLQPGHFLAEKLQSAPGGVLAVGGSFLLFALGTLAAFTKSKWNRPTVLSPESIQPKANV